MSENYKNFLAMKLEGMRDKAVAEGADTVSLSLNADEVTFLVELLGNVRAMHDTVDLMLSDNYKDRFVAEYMQTKLRYERLKAFNTKIEAAHAVCDRDRVEGALPSVQMPKHDCPDYMLREQQEVMGRYLHILEVRAVIEGVDLGSI